MRRPSPSGKNIRGRTPNPTTFGVTPAMAPTANREETPAATSPMARYGTPVAAVAENEPADGKSVSRVGASGTDAASEGCESTVSARILGANAIIPSNVHTDRLEGRLIQRAWGTQSYTAI